VEALLSESEYTLDAFFSLQIFPSQTYLFILQDLVRDSGPGGRPGSLRFPRGETPLAPIRGSPGAWTALPPRPRPRGTAGPRREGLM